MQGELRNLFPQLRELDLRPTALLAQLRGAHELEDLHGLRHVHGWPARMEELSNGGDDTLVVGRPFRLDRTGRRRHPDQRLGRIRFRQAAKSTDATVAPGARRDVDVSLVPPGQAGT